MSIVAFEVNEKKKKLMLDFYNEHMTKEKVQAKSFNTLDDFKQSDAYKDLSDEEKDHFKQYEGKNVIILIFDSVDQALEFINEAQTKGIFSKEQAEAAITKLNESKAPSNKM